MRVAIALTRVAIALTGEMRGDEHCLRMLEKHVVKPFEDAGATVDIFCHTRKDQWWNSAALLRFRCLWVEDNRRRDESLILSEHNPRSLGSYVTADPNDRRAFLYQSYLQQYYSMQAVALMIARAEEQDRKSYDWIVRSRPDIYLREPLPVGQLDPNAVNCPWNEWWPYEVDGKRVDTVNDKFAVGPAGPMLTYLNKIVDLQAHCQQYRLQGEWFTAWHIDRRGIKWLRHDRIETVRTKLEYQCSEKP